MTTKVYQDDMGTILLVDAGSDLSSASITNININKPTQAQVIWTGSIHTETLQEYVDDTTWTLSSDVFSGSSPGDSVSRRVKYVITSGDLDMSGVYKGQLAVVMPTWNGRGETFDLKISPSFN